MTARVLVVDDEEPIVRTVGDIVESMDHSFDSAGDVETARGKLEKGIYDLLVLDMNLPMSPGRLSGRRENGRNFIEIIRNKMGLKDLPIIVVTGQDKGEAEFILSVVNAGGIDRTQYVQKPIDGDKLDKAIRRALTKPASTPAPVAPPSKQAGAAKPSKLEPFSAAKRELVIYPENIELCGIEVWSDRSSSDMREIAIELARKRCGHYVRVKGVAFAEKLGRDASNPVGRIIKSFCDNAVKAMATHCGLSCGRYDVISSDSGYHFTDWIDAVIVDAEGKRTGAPDDQTAGPVADAMAKLDGLPAGQAERLLAICEALEKRETMGVADVRKLTGASRPQTTRDLKVLVDRGLVEKTGPRLERLYRLACGK